MSIWGSLAGYGSSLGQDFMGGFGGLTPGYANLTPEQQQAAAYGNIAQFGAGVLGGGNRGAGNLGTGLKYAQNSALQRNRGEIASAMFQEQMKDAKEEREKAGRRNEAYEQMIPALSKQSGVDPSVFSNLGYTEGIKLWKDMRQGRWATAEEKQQWGFKPEDPIHISKDGTPKLVGGRAQDRKSTRLNSSHAR